MSGSDRQNRYRQRQRRRTAAYIVEFADRLRDQLVDLGRLTETESGDRASVALEIAALAEERISLLRLEK